MNCQLTLRPAEIAQREPCAWFVRGDSAEVWLRALAALPINQTRAKLLVIGAALADRRPLGALIVADSSLRRPSANENPAAPFAQPYGCIAGRLFLPIEGILSPPATAAEIADLLADDSLYVWHPSAGLTQFSAHDCRSAADFLCPPAESRADWNRAAQGTAFNTRLLSLTVESVPTVEEMMNDVRGDIGTRAASLGSLPASRNERRAGPLAHLTVALANFNRTGSSQPTSGTRAWERFAIVCFIWLLMLAFFNRSRSLPHGGAPPLASTPAAQPPTTPPTAKPPASTPPAAPATSPPAGDRTLPLAHPVAFLLGMWVWSFLIWWLLVRWRRNRGGRSAQATDAPRSHRKIHRYVSACATAVILLGLLAILVGLAGSDQTAVTVLTILTLTLVYVTVIALVVRFSLFFRRSRPAVPRRPQLAMTRPEPSVKRAHKWLRVYLPIVIPTLFLFFLAWLADLDVATTCVCLVALTALMILLSQAVRWAAPQRGHDGSSPVVQPAPARANHPAPVKREATPAASANKVMRLLLVVPLLLFVPFVVVAKLNMTEAVAALVELAALAFLFHSTLILLIKGSRSNRNRLAAKRALEARKAASQPVQSTSQPVVPDRRRWFAKMRAWATGAANRAAESIEAARHRELDRLMDMLEANPDKGLQFALPLAGDVMRGLATPGARLNNRVVDFGRRQGGSRPADVWDIHQEYRRKLTLRYRDLANREIGLQRHRRAAYILADLLGDWNAAAQALVAGAHFHEAAVIYDERLQRPLAAAQCLERGGQISAALVIYERLKMPEKVGDLYRQLEQADQAEAAYLRAVEARRIAGDRLAAARLLEDKLGRPEEAWQELAGGWPNSPHLAGCLQAAFEWTERHRDFARAQGFLHEASAAAISAGQTSVFVERTAALATGYPNPDVRAAAAETTMQVVSARLPSAAPAELKALTKAIRRLSPDDRLLIRDCDRYARQQPTAAAQRAAARSEKQLELRLQRTFPIANVCACVASASALYLAGWRAQELVLVRANWDGVFQYPDQPPWVHPTATPETPILMAICQQTVDWLYVQPFGSKRCEVLGSFLETDAFRDQVQIHSTLSPHTVGLTSNDTLNFAVYAEPRLLTIQRYSLNPQVLQGTWIYTLPSPVPIPLIYQERQGTHFLALEDRIYFTHASDLLPLFEFDAEIVRLVASPVHTRPRLIASFAAGAQILWGVASGVASTRFAEDLAAPQILIHRDGWIIAADRVRCEVYRPIKESLRLHIALNWEDLGEVVALTSARAINEFAVVTARGAFRIFTIPPLD
ncbi:MAG TPA: hypothetical protein VFE24_05765 [Pirellulales bacterium]|jgi:tetratricopeptide (TPR) repeat protein|nr:hypothetical protein [Pirellulales bacterium]